MSDDADIPIIVCIRVGREIGPILPTAQKVPCSQCGVTVWQSTFPGKASHPAFHEGEWLARDVPAEASPWCTPCALKAAKEDRDMELHAMLWEAAQRSERLD